MSKGISKRALSLLLAGLMAASAGTMTAMAADPDEGSGQFKDYFSIGSRKVGLAIENIPDFAEYGEDFSLEDEDGDGIYEGSFTNLIIDFPEYDEVSFRLRLDDKWDSCWGAANDYGYTYGSDIPVTVKLIEGETLNVRFDTRDGEDYRHWKIETNKSLSLDPEYDALYIYAGNPEQDQAYIQLKDEDNDGIYEGYADSFELFGYDFSVNYDMYDGFNWYSDGKSGTQFGSGSSFKNDAKEGEAYKFYFDTTDPDYHNWKLTYKKTVSIYETENGTNLTLRIGDDTDTMDLSLSDEDGDGIYTATADASELVLGGPAYAYLDGFTDYRQTEDGDMEKYYTYTWGSDGKGGTQFGSTRPVDPDAYDGMIVTYEFDTTDDDYHNWTLTAKSAFDLTDPYLFAVGSFSGWDIDQKYMLFDDDGDGIYTCVIEKPGKGEYYFLIKYGETWESFWRKPDSEGITFRTDDVQEGIQTNVSANVTDPGQNIYINFDTTDEDYHKWIPSAEVKIPPYEFPDNKLYSWCENARIELTDENGDGIYTGVFEGLAPGTLNFQTGVNGDRWSVPDDAGITFNNGLPIVCCTVNEGENVYVSLDTTGGNYQTYPITYRVTMPVQPLENQSVIRPDITTVGSKILVYGVASGGTAPYKYKYSVVHVQSGEAMDTPDGFVEDSPIEVTLTKYGEYDVKVQIMDAEGNVTDDNYLMEAMAYKAPLTNQSYTVPESTTAIPTVNVGEKIKLVGKAEGGTEPYTYSYYYKRSTNNSWKTIKANTTSTSATLTPTSAAVFDIKIEIKDADGETVEAYFMAEAKEAENPLKNTSKISADSIKAGETVKITGAAEGGTAPYTYSYYFKRTVNTVWKAIKENSTSTSANLTATAAASYDIKVVVKDSTEKTEESIFTVTAKEVSKMKNTSVINSDKVQIGDKVRVAAAASGGTAPYSYAYYYKRSTNTAWKKLGTEWGTNSSVAFAPTAAATYDFKVAVKDSTGEIVEKIFTVTAVEELELTNVSAINCSTLKLGSNVKLTGKAVGGKSPYTYSFAFKRSANAAFKTIGTAYSGETTAKIKPTTEGDYDFRVIVKDDAGTKVAKYFTVTVIK